MNNSILAYTISGQHFILINKLQIDTMLRIAFLLTLFILASAYDQQETALLIRKMQEKRLKIQDLQLQLAKAEKRAKQYENKYLALLSRGEANCVESRSQKDSQAKIRGLQDQIKILQLKERNFDQYFKRVNTLEQEIATKQSAHLNQIIKLKDDCQQRIKNIFKQNFNSVSAEVAEKDAECKREANSFRDRIKFLEDSAASKAKQFAEKIGSTRTQFITRAKNFLSGKGPYTKQEEEAFAEFKSKVNTLEEKIKQKLQQIDKIKQEKSDIEFQQKYCRAKLTNYDQQIKQLEREAISKGKGYYVEELKRLHKQRIEDQSHTTNEDLKAYEQKIVAMQEKLRLQLEENHSLYQQKRDAEQKIAQFRDRQSELKTKNDQCESEVSKFKLQIAQLRKLIKEIYGLKDK